MNVYTFLCRIKDQFECVCLRSSEIKERNKIYNFFSSFFFFCLIGMLRVEPSVTQDYCPISVQYERSCTTLGCCTAESQHDLECSAQARILLLYWTQLRQHRLSAAPIWRPNLDQDVYLHPANSELLPTAVIIRNMLLHIH